jgi:hypothetical protein
MTKDFLLEIIDNNIECAAGEQVSRGVVVARLGKLSVGGRAGHVRQSQARQKHDYGKNNYQSSAFGCSITSTDKILHSVLAASLCRGVAAGIASLCTAIQRRGYSRMAQIFQGVLSVGGETYM